MIKEPYKIPENKRAFVRGVFIDWVADSKSRKAYARWLAERLAKGVLPVEDLERVAYDLTLFHRRRDRIAHPLSDIFHHRDLISFYDLFKPFDKKLAARADHYRRVAKINSAPQETLVLHESRGLKILIPLSQAAACRYGQGTRWCLSKTVTENYFWYYALQAPPIMIMAGEGPATERFCIHPETGQWRNAEEQEVGTETLMRRFPMLAGLIRPYFSPVKLVRQFPAAMVSAEEARAAKEITDRIPDWIFDDPAVSQAREQELLRDVPEKMRNERVCWEAIRKDGRNLDGVPKQMRSEEMCVIAVQNYPWAVKDVPRDVMERIAEPQKLEEMIRLRLAARKDGSAAENDAAREWISSFVLQVGNRGFYRDYDDIMRHVGIFFDAKGQVRLPGTDLGAVNSPERRTAAAPADLRATGLWGPK